MNFAGRQYFGLSPSGLAVSRASAGTCPDAGGNYYQFGSNVARICPGTGLWVEEARTNGIRNSVASGAAAGTPGTMPTNWSLTGIPTGVTATINGYVSQNGINLLSLTLSGTNTSGGNAFIGINFEGTSTAAALYGQTWAASVSLQSSGATQLNWGQRIVEATSGNGFLTQSGNLNAAAPATLARQSGSYTLVNPATAYVYSYIGNSVMANGASISQTLLIGWPQLENNSLINSSVASATIAAGGSGGTNGTNVNLTVGGGTCPTPPVIQGTISGNALTAITGYGTPGSCTVFPPSPAAVTGNSLAGASVNLTPTNNAALAFATTPIPTSGSAATRAQDSIYAAIPARVAYSLAAVATPEAPIGYPASQVVASVYDSGTNNRATLTRYPGTGNSECDSWVSGSRVYNAIGGVWSQSAAGKIGVAEIGGAQNCAFNTTLQSPGTASPIPTTTTKFGLGSTLAVAPLNGAIARATLWNGTAISPSLLKQVTR